MRRVLPLLFLVLLPALPALVACSGSGDDQGQAVVTFVTPVVPTATPTPVGPTPTPAPPPELMLSTVEVYQAGAILASLVGDVSGGSITFLGRTYPLTKGTQSYYAFLSVGTEDRPGPAGIKVDFILKNGSKGTLTDQVTVLATDWTVDSLEFTEEQTTNLLDPKVVAAENATLEQVYGQYTPEKLWAGNWLVPAPGAITARMGEQRAVNGGAPSGHHGGTDIGNAEGTPVQATNRGRVVLARSMSLRGNMVIIDHGGGLFSGYGHMSEILVQEGQVVEAGDVIGKVGNTGLSTGAHLHWEIAANGILVDALRFTDGSNGF